ncbi:hypothetical protein NW762_006806 [Fusarium torreyae]|uniref:Uncharacterized protein n=1 Tax=Fusarium torreyae TaxID=1237075 RepID=A0A9W8S0Q0_9HYPO|nr:hypothetical protein NW762_006806 [Fusarium torreyae]
MGNFGTAVTSLLDTYTKCLSLLKGFRNDDAGTLSETRSTLSTSLRSDRARVRRAYSSRLSQDGSRFEKGDAPARSALRRIVKKLTTTLTDVVRTFHDPKGQPVNYESLLALSNGSSLDAIRTMNDLSSRVGSTISPSSRGSIVSRGRQRSRRHKHNQQTGTRSERRSEGRSKRDRTKSKQSASRRGRASADRHSRQGSGGRQTPEILAAHKRVSIMTTSSDSTKLGEIRRRLSKQRPDEGYGKKVAYPLYSYHTEEVQARRKWWNPFKRS